MKLWESYTCWDFCEYEKEQNYDCNTHWRGAAHHILYLSWIPGKSFTFLLFISLLFFMCRPEVPLCRSVRFCFSFAFPYSLIKYLYILNIHCELTLLRRFFLVSMWHIMELSQWLTWNHRTGRLWSWVVQLFWTHQFKWVVIKFINTSLLANQLFLKLSMSRCIR